MRRKLLYLILVLVPSILYVGVAVYWHMNQFNPIIGDEPHYLLTAESIVRDHDISVSNNYSEETPVSEAMGTQLSGSDPDHIVNTFSVHGIGLPLLIALPYALAGVVGAKVFLALLIGVTLPLVVFHNLLGIIGETNWSAFLTLTFVCSLPFLAGSNQVYSDLIVGTLVLNVTSHLLNAERQCRLSSKELFVLGIEIAFLPWLYKRYIPATVVLLALLVWVTSRTKRNSAVDPALYAGFGASAVSLVALGAFQYIAFGNVLGYFAANQIQTDITWVAMIFGGLHWDSFQGMFIQVPILLFALPGIIPFSLSHRKGALMVALTYLAIMLPGAMNFGWYGGASFAGRYTWVGLGLWIFPLGYAVRLLLRNSLGKIILFLACLSSLAFQLALARVWLTHNRYLYNESLNQPFWAVNDLLTSLFHLGFRAQSLLPAFRNFNLYTQHVPNYLVILFSLLLVATGAWMCGALQRKYLLAASWFGLGATAVLTSIFFTPPIEPIILRGTQLSTIVGNKEGTRLRATPGKRGLLAFGPYIKTFPDRAYSITIQYETGRRSIGTFDFDLDYERQIIAGGRLPPSAENGGQFHYTFVMPPRQDGTGAPSIFAFRLNYGGAGRLIVKSFEIEPAAN